METKSITFEELKNLLIYKNVEQTNYKNPNVYINFGVLKKKDVYPMDDGEKYFEISVKYSKMLYPSLMEEIEEKMAQNSYRFFIDEWIGKTELLADALKYEIIEEVENNNLYKIIDK